MCWRGSQASPLWTDGRNFCWHDTNALLFQKEPTLACVASIRISPAYVGVYHNGEDGCTLLYCTGDGWLAVSGTPNMVADFIRRLVLA